MNGRKPGENGEVPEGLDGAEKETRVTGSGRGGGGWVGKEKFNIAKLSLPTAKAE